MYKMLMITFGDVEDPENGYAIRVRNLIDCLSKYDLRIIEFISKKPKDARIIAVKNFSNYVIQGLSITYYSLKFWKEIRSSDILIVEGSMFLPFIFFGRLLRKKVIHDFHGSIVEVGKKGKGIKNFLLRILIGGILDKLSIILANATTAVSEEDTKKVKEYWKKAKVYTVIHGIDLDRIPFLGTTTADKIKKALFVGNLKAYNNYTAVEKIIEVAKSLPNITFIIIGEGSEQFKDYPQNVKFLGFVDNLSEVYKEADACFVPLTAGTGVKTKVLECMAYGKPVITTDIGVQGLKGIERLMGIYVLDSKEDFVKFLQGFKIDKSFDPSSLREYVKENFSKELTCKQLLNVIEELVHDS